MKKFLIAFFMLFSSLTFAEDLTLNFNSVSVSQFSEAAFKVMMKRDYVLSTELLQSNKVISISIKKIDSEKLPRLIESVLSSQGISTELIDGVYYLDLKKQQQEKFSQDKTISESTQQERPQLTDNEKQSQVYFPQHRDAEFISTSLNALFLKSSSVADGAVILYAQKNILTQIINVAEQIDRQVSKVKISATFVEVSSNNSTSMGVSVVADLLGSKLGLNVGDITSGVLSLKGSNFQIVLDALSTDGRFKQVSNPSVVVDDYKKTVLSFGDSVPTVGSTTLDRNGNPIQQIQYQQSGVILDVTPRVLGSKKINLTLDGQVSSFASTLTGVTASPTLSKRQIQSNLTMSDGEILVIGGLNNNKDIKNKSWISFLPESFPFNKSESSASTDLVLILTASLQ